MHATASSNPYVAILLDVNRSIFFFPARCVPFVLSVFSCYTPLAGRWRYPPPESEKGVKQVGYHIFQETTNEASEIVRSRYTEAGWGWIRVVGSGPMLKSHEFVWLGQGTPVLPDISDLGLNPPRQ